MADKSVGRPLKFASAEELKRKIDEYFESCYEEVWEQDKDGKWHPVYDRLGNIEKRQIEHFTISGLAVFLDTTRRTLLDYEERDDEYSHAIKQAKAKIEYYTEKQLYNPTARNMTGIIFNLKNNYGWQDKTEIDNNIGNKDEKPFEVTQRLKSLDPKELAQLEHILAKTADSG